GGEGGRGPPRGAPVAGGGAPLPRRPPAPARAHRRRQGPAGPPASPVRFPVTVTVTVPSRKQEAMTRRRLTLVALLALVVIASGVSLAQRFGGGGGRRRPTTTPGVLPEDRAG